MKRESKNTPTLLLERGFSIDGEVYLADSSLPGFKWIKVAGLSVGDNIIVPKDLFFGVGEDDNEINRNDYTGNDKENNFLIHNRLFSSIASDRPKIDNQGKDTRENIKDKKIHGVFSAILANFADILRNAEVMAMPPINVSHGILPLSPRSKYAYNQRCK